MMVCFIHEQREQTMSRRSPRYWEILFFLFAMGVGVLLFFALDVDPNAVDDAFSCYIAVNLGDNDAIGINARDSTTVATDQCTAPRNKPTISVWDFDHRDRVGNACDGGHNAQGV